MKLEKASRRLVVLATLAGVLAACRESFRALGVATPTPSAHARAESLFSALGARVITPTRDAKFERARARIANAALIPSRIWNDTSVWTSSSDSARALLVGGRSADSGYRFETSPTVPAPTRPAEQRRVINLTRVDENAFSWDTEVDYAIGATTAPEFAAFARAFFASAESRTERDVRADLAAVVPRTAAALGRVFRLDSVHTSRLPDGSTLATFMVSMTPDSIRKRYPKLRDYLRKYISPTKMRWSLTDATGANFVDLWLSNEHLLFRVRTRNGRMVSLASPARPMPDSLTLNGEMTMRVRGFTCGIREYHAAFTTTRTENEIAWNIVSRREPQWVLPLLAERLLKTPLRRPFTGNGSLYRIGVRDTVGGQTVIRRRLHLEVQESGILRFVGRLGAIAVADYRGDSERELNAWLREVFTGLVEDVKALH